MLTYSCKYYDSIEKIKIIDNVVGDLFENNFETRILFTEDHTRIEILTENHIFEFSSNRYFLLDPTKRPKFLKPYIVNYFDEIFIKNILPIEAVTDGYLGNKGYRYFYRPNASVIEIYKKINYVFYPERHMGIEELMKKESGQVL